MTEIKVTPGFFFLCGAFLLFCGFDTAFCTLVAVVVHEFSHVAAAAYFGGRLSEISFSFFGISMKAVFSGLTSYRCDLFCALAGPLANIVLGVFVAVFSESDTGFIFAGTNLLFGAYNLIPASGLDGGTVIESVFKSCLPVCFAERLLFLVALLFSGIVFTLGLFVFFRSF